MEVWETKYEAVKDSGQRIGVWRTNSFTHKGGGDVIVVKVE